MRGWKIIDYVKRRRRRCCKPAAAMHHRKDGGGGGLTGRDCQMAQFSLGITVLENCVALIVVEPFFVSQRHKLQLLNRNGDSN